MSPSHDINELFKEYEKGNRLALARLITIVESRTGHYEEVIEKLYPHLNKTPRIGITGPPGVGKSSLVTELVHLLRETHDSLGIIAIDPSSPFTGGALLGDRIRMNRISLDPGVFIRSLATRGSLGGLAVATEDTADLMDGFGCEMILIETVGVGQVELDIVKTADTTMVTLSPESGDSIQAMKAGLMEIGDVFILNKCDRDGADRAYLEIDTALAHRPIDGWKPPIIKTSAHTGEGIGGLLKAVQKHQEYLQTDNKIVRNRLERRKAKIKMIVETGLLNNYWSPQALEKLDDLTRKDISVITAARDLIED